MLFVDQYTLMLCLAELDIALAACHPDPLALFSLHGNPHAIARHSETGKVLTSPHMCRGKPSQHSVRTRDAAPSPRVPRSPAPPGARSSQTRNCAPRSQLYTGARTASAVRTSGRLIPWADNYVCKDVLLTHVILGHLHTRTQHQQRLACSKCTCFLWVAAHFFPQDNI